MAVVVSKRRYLVDSKPHLVEASEVHILTENTPSPDEQYRSLSSSQLIGFESRPLKATDCRAVTHSNVSGSDDAQSCCVFVLVSMVIVFGLEWVIFIQFSSVMILGIAPVATSSLLSYISSRSMPCLLVLKSMQCFCCQFFCKEIFHFDIFHDKRQNRLGHTTAPTT